MGKHIANLFVRMHDAFFKDLKQLMFFLIICFFVSFISGCLEQKSGGFQAGKSSSKSNISMDDLQSKLDEFEELFTSRIKAAGAEIDVLSSEPKVIKMTLLWRSRAIAAIHNIKEQSQPMMVLADSWLLCIRLSNFIESGEAGNTFGEYQHLALETSKELESQIESIGRRVLPENLFEETSAGLKRLALANPIQSGFSKSLMYSTQVKTEDSGLFQSLISIPLSPVRALEGVDRTPKAIYDFSNTTKHLTDVLEELPESTRWQLLLLLYDIEETNLVTSLLKSMENISSSSTRLSSAAEKFTSLLETSDEKQTQIQASLVQVNETISNLEHLLVSAQAAGATFSQTARDVNTATYQWAQAAESTKAVIEQIMPKKPAGAVPEGKKMDLKETAEAIGSAAKEIKAASESLPGKTEALVGQLNTLVTRITVSVVLIIILIFSLFVAYFLIKGKFKFSEK